MKKTTLILLAVAALLLFKSRSKSGVVTMPPSAPTRYVWTDNHSFVVSATRPGDSSWVRYTISWYNQETSAYITTDIAQPRPWIASDAGIRGLLVGMAQGSRLLLRR